MRWASGGSSIGLVVGVVVLVVLTALGHVARAEAARDGTGYLEGRIIAIGGGAARVRLDRGDTVVAQLPSNPDVGAVEAGVPPFHVGDHVVLYFSPYENGTTVYAVSDWVRRPALYALGFLFMLVAVVVARFKGLRAVVSTAISLVIVIGFIVPRILAGWNPAVVTLLGVGGMLAVAIYFVHGLNWSTTAALVGTACAVGVTMLVAVVFTGAGHITGFGTEDAMLINLNASAVNLRGLVLAGMLVGALGALTDITIVQASVVRELAHTDPAIPLWELYRRGMNVGLDHIGSLVNTLVLAYTGSALSLFLLLSLSQLPLSQAINLEMVAVEVIHTLVGSIGLMLAVPLTTLVAAGLFRGNRLRLAPEELSHAHRHH